MKPLLTIGAHLLEPHRHRLAELDGDHGGCSFGRVTELSQCLPDADGRGMVQAKG